MHMFVCVQMPISSSLRNAMYCVVVRSTVLYGLHVVCTVSCCIAVYCSVMCSTVLYGLCCVYRYVLQCNTV